MSSQTPTILIPARWGTVARLLLRSCVTNRLVEMGGSVVIASPVPDLTALKQEFEATNMVVEPLVLPREWLSQVFSRMHSYFFRTMIPTPTSAVREEQMRISNPRQYATVRLLKGRPLNLLFRLWRWVSRLALANNRNQGLFEKYHPDLVIVNTLGRRLEDFYLLRLAKRHGVRTLAAIESWDTLTTKEYVYERPDKVIVWNKQNRDEACTLHDFVPGDVYVAGAPHFDLYFRPWALPSRTEHLTSLELDPERQLLFVTGQPFIASSNIEVSMRTLAGLLNENLLAQPCQALFRPHPAVYVGEAPGVGTDEDLQRFEKLSPYIHVNRPQRSHTGLLDDMDPTEAQRTAATLYHMAMLLDFFGTLSVEACLVDKPVLYLGLGTDAGGVGHESMQRRAGFTHVQLLLQSGAGRLVTTPDELIAGINRYLRDPGSDADARAQVAYRVAYEQDGQAGCRMAQAIWAYANGIWPPAGDNCEPMG